MKSKSRLFLSSVAAIALSATITANAAEKSKKLLVYVLAGQSNMQGHAEVSTLAYLPKPAYVPTPEEWAILTSWLERDIRVKMEPVLKENLLKDPANAKLPKNEFNTLLANALKAETDKIRAERYEAFKKRQTDPVRAARDKELAAIFTPNLTDAKVLEAQAAAKSQKLALDSANTWVEKTGIPVAKRTYIAAYGGVNRAEQPGEASGPLTTGYGARPTAFGPEYAFGIMMEKQLDQPILIIKTAWGGKSIHYDFRPPSAGPYQPTANEKEQMERWKVNKAAWDQYLAGGGTAAAMAQIEKDWKAIEAEKRTFQPSIAKLPKEEQAAAQQKLAEMNQKSKDLQKNLIRNPGDMPSKDAAGFYWKEMTTFIQKVLADPKAYHPEYDAAAGYEVAGGLWFQGFNDQFDPEYYGNYASNMVHYIQDLRKEVKQPNMPFVIGVLGTPAFPEEALTNNVAVAQREAAKNPALTNVAAIESWPLTTPEVALWRMKRETTPKTDAAEYEKAEQQWILHGSNLGYHYDGSGRFFIRLGDEFASAILKLKR
jgi:hypothetical protein